MFRMQRNRQTAINNAFEFIPHKLSLKMLIKETQFGLSTRRKDKVKCFFLHASLLYRI